jgi:hypothetical protein
MLLLFSGDASTLGLLPPTVVRKLRQAMARSIDGSGGSLRDTDMIT